MAQCPQPPKGSKASKCYQCGQSGHRKAECPTQVAVAQHEQKDSICVVCTEMPPDWIFDKCHHQCVCEHCAKLLDKCPMCRSVITTGGKVFKV